MGWQNSLVAEKVRVGTVLPALEVGTREIGHRQRCSYIMYEHQESITLKY